MGTTILRSAYTTRVDAILQGISVVEYTAPNRLLALDSMLARYSQDFPKRRTVDMAGDGDNYYVLYGQTTKVLNSTRDATVDLTSSGADSKLAVSFTLPYRMQVHAVRLLLKRIDTGALAGTVACEILLPGASIPATIVAQTSASLALDAADIPLGYEEGKTEFRFTDPTPLDAGTYYAALVPSGYTYSDGATEIALGVDQSSVDTNTLYTFDGTSTWTAYSTDSAVVVEVLASLPSWQYRWSYFKGADIPAPTISDNEVPQPLEDEDMHQVNVEETEYIYFPNHAPVSTQTIRLSYAAQYSFKGTPSATDVPEAHFEAVCQLGAYYICLNLASGAATNIDSGHAFDISERRGQSDIYASRAKGFLKAYAAMLGIKLAEEGSDTTIVPAMTIGDMDRGTYSPREPLFHSRRRR